MTDVFKPSDILADDENYTTVKGFKLRKGTVAAVLKNIDVTADPESTQEAKDAAYAAIEEASTALVLLGLWQHLTFKDPKIQRYVDAAAQHLKAEDHI